MPRRTIRWLTGPRRPANGLPRRRAGDVTVETRETSAETRIAPAMLARWFTPAPEAGAPATANTWQPRLNPEELAHVQGLYERAACRDRSCLGAPSPLSWWRVPCHGSRASCPFLCPSHR